MGSQTSSTLVFQSHHSLEDDWLKRCVESVKSWSQLQGFDYQWMGDEFFEINPHWFNEKVRGRGPILSDLARLRYSQRMLKSYTRVIWFDADIFLFKPLEFLIPSQSYLLGRECWVQPHKKGLRFGWKVYRNLCNAFLMFERENPLLDYYLHACERIIQHADPNWIAPQMIGPKFLTALNSISPLYFTDQIGSASPHLLRDLAQFSTGENQHDLPALEQMRQTLGHIQCCGLNLCGSLVGHPAYDSTLINPTLLSRAMDALENHCL